LNKGPACRQAGFTIIELVVTTSILVIVSTLIFVDYPGFQSNISLKKAAQEVALTIRQAQVYGLGVREFQTGTGIYPGYGVHFDVASPDAFVLFADINSDNIYSGAQENVELFKIQTGEKISDICVSGGACGFNTADIIFFRPKPLVVIKANGSSYSGVEIKIISPRGQIKTIVILSSGQISIK